MLAAVGVVCVVSMMILTTADVVARYAFNEPTMWADEIASYLLIAIVFLGLAQNLRLGSHIRIDVVTNLLSARVCLMLEVFAYAVGFVFSMMLLAGTWTRFDNFWVRHTTSDSILMTPLWIAMVPVVIGAAALGLTMLLGFINSLHAVLAGPASETNGNGGGPQASKT
jgi:C4-dicarboxylate transporter, DctQ subunit